MLFTTKTKETKTTISKQLSKTLFFNIKIETKKLVFVGKHSYFCNSCSSWYPWEMIFPIDTIYFFDKKYFINIQLNVTEKRIDRHMSFHQKNKKKMLIVSLCK